MERIINDTERNPEENSYNCNEEYNAWLDQQEENYIMMIQEQEPNPEVIE